MRRAVVPADAAALPGSITFSQARSNLAAVLFETEDSSRLVQLAQSEGG